MRPGAGQQRPDLRLGGGIVGDNQHRPGDLSQHRPVQPGPLLCTGRDVLSCHPEGPQQRIQRLAGLNRHLVVTVQIDEQHPAAEPAPAHRGVPSLHGQGGLAHPGQPRHRRHHHRTAHTSRVQQTGQHRQLILSAGEPGHRRGQLRQRDRRRGHGPGGIQPGQPVQDVAEHAFQPLALQMGHVVVELGSQREQRPAPGAAGKDLAQQPAGQRARHGCAFYAQHVGGGLAGAGHAGIVEHG